MKLYLTQTCPFVQRVLIALELRQFDKKQISFVEVDLSNPPQSMLALNPFGSVPTLELQSGVGFNESLVVMEYLDSLAAPGDHLFGSSPSEAARIKALIEESSSKLLGTLQTALYAFGQVNTVRKAARALPESWNWLEYKLAEAKGSYFGGTQMNAVDVALAPFVVRLKWLFEKYPDLPKPSTGSRAENYLHSVSTHPAVVKTLPSEEIVRSSLIRFLNPHPQLQAVIDAPRAIIEDPSSALIEAGSSMSKWTISHDGKGYCLKANFHFKAHGETVDKLTWLHNAQETSDHHTSITMRDFQDVEITLVTHEPRWGVSQKDLALARAIQTYFVEGKLP